MTLRTYRMNAEATVESIKASIDALAEQSDDWRSSAENAEMHSDFEAADAYWEKYDEVRERLDGMESTVDDYESLIKGLLAVEDACDALNIKLEVGEWAN